MYTHPSHSLSLSSGHMWFVALHDTQEQARALAQPEWCVDLHVKCSANFYLIFNYKGAVNSRVQVGLGVGVFCDRTPVCVFQR